MTYNKIASGSSGNAIIYDETILVDFGVAYKYVKPFLNSIKYLLLTHRHTDHLNISAILRMVSEYPDIDIIGHEETIGLLSDFHLDNLFVIDSNEWFELGDYTVASVDLIHDEKNIGYRILKPIFEDGKYVRDYKIFHATDTRDLFNVEAVGYDIYFIEFNHCEEIINRNIEERHRLGKFAHGVNAREYHQSNQRAKKWLEKNNIAGGKIVPLHISLSNNTKEEVLKYV